MFVAGGSVLACITPGIDFDRYRTDFDLFLYGLTEVLISSACFLLILILILILILPSSPPSPSLRPCFPGPRNT